MTPGMKPDPEKQPLYVPPEERVSLDDLKHRAETIQNLAVVQAKDVTREVYEQNATKALLVAVGVVVVAASFAYFMGRHAAERAMRDLGPL